jgi:excisionase family DNA binding protein
LDCTVLKDLPPRGLLTPREAADFFRVTPRTVYLWIDRGDLEAVRIAGSMRIPKAEILRILCQEESTT